MSEILIRCMKETCGLRQRKIAEPWMIGREWEVERRRAEISDLVQKRNKLMSRPQTRHIGRIVDGVRAELKGKRRELKGS